MHDIKNSREFPHWGLSGPSSLFSTYAPMQMKAKQISSMEKHPLNDKKVYTDSDFLSIYQYNKLSLQPTSNLFL